MKKCLVSLFVVCVIFLSACSKKEPEKVNTINGKFKTYYEMSDGTWQADGYIYRYRLAVKGRMKSAAKDSEFVYLSNIENITFEQAWKAAGLSSSSLDYFEPKTAVLVEWN